MTVVPHRISRLLVANRGEIACRIFRTAHAMGVGSVAVYATADAGARHVREADLAVLLHGSSVTDTYLDIAQVLAAATTSGADAVHPGYGFLAENADFAEAVIAAGLVWVGPTPAQIRVMGSKVESKAAAAAAGVPLPLWAAIVGDDSEAWVSAAADVGFPLLVKASAGGGGKGMRRVETTDHLGEAVRAARREAASAFGDSTVFVERALDGARHVEVQVFGDTHGSLVHLGERECSIQRRHQKVIEESPSPGTDARTRELLLEAAVSLARSVGYVGAGTVELLVVGSGATQEFFFLEMNTRLQVEHPVTEAVTGLDLVALQLRVAQGLPLGFTQDDVRIDGHAVEARVYAEDPSADHRPSTGTVLRWDEAAGVRWDSGVEAGDEVSTHYDPMLAKVVAHAASREEAVASLARALRTSAPHGVITNTASLVAVLESPDFRAGDTPTDFLDRHPEVLTAGPPAEVARAQVAAAVAHREQDRRRTAPVLAFPPSGWRNVRAVPQAVEISVAGQAVQVTYVVGADGDLDLTVGAEQLRGRVDPGRAGVLDLEVNGLRTSYAVTVAGGSDESSPTEVWVTGQGWTSRLVESARFPVAETAAGAGALSASLPGTVTKVLVEVGAEVGAGDPLVLVEAMKMEHRISAAVAGTVTAVLVAEGDSVEAHQQLVTVEASAVEPVSEAG